jgi:hypothetical protein
MDNLFEILYAKPIATKRVMIPAEIVIIRFALMTYWKTTVVIIAGTAITIASKVPLIKIFSKEMFTSPFSEFGFNFKFVILL